MPTARLPRYVRPKRLKGRVTAYYWELPTWAKAPATRHGRTCPIESAALGTSLAAAIEKAEHLNDAFDDWRKGVYSRLVPGSVAWLFVWYREQERFTKNSAKTRSDYTKIMSMLSAFPMKVGTLGERKAGAIDATTADTLYGKLKHRGPRQATYAMQVCRLVWTWALRHGSVTGISANPFSKMSLASRSAKGNRPTSRIEYDLYRDTARKEGYPSMAVAAALIFELCQRVSDAFGFWIDESEDARCFLWEGYKPGEEIALTQSKTGKAHIIPLSDSDGHGGWIALYPDLEDELARLRGAREGLSGLIVLRDRNGEPYSERYASMIHRKICEKAGLPKDMTLTGFRHGGTTEIGDTGEADPRAITGHTELKTTAIYNKASAEKARRIGRARRAYVDEAKRNVGMMSEGVSE